MKSVKDISRLAILANTALPNNHELDCEMLRARAQIHPPVKDALATPGWLKMVAESQETARH